MVQTRVMHPDVFDTLEFGSLAFGGIGAGDDFEHTAAYDTQYDCPLCVWGVALAATNTLDDTEMRPIADELRRLGIYRSVNDAAVMQIQKREDYTSSSSARVSFKEWTKQLRVVRGNAEDFMDGPSSFGPIEHN